MNYYCKTCNKRLPEDEAYIHDDDGELICADCYLVWLRKRIAESKAQERIGSITPADLPGPLDWC